MLKVYLVSALFCVLLLSPVYGVRFEAVGSSFSGQLSGYAGDQPKDDPDTPEREEDVLGLEGSFLNMYAITRNSTQTVWNERYAYAEAKVEGCGLTASYGCWTNSVSNGDGNTETTGRASIGFAVSGGPNAHFRVSLDEEPSHTPFIAHLRFEFYCHNVGSGATSRIMGYNDEILVRLTRNGQTTTIYSHPAISLSDEGTLEDSYSADITVYEDDVIFIYGGTENQLLKAVVNPDKYSQSYANMSILLELDPDESPADITGNYIVNLEDFAVFASYWLKDEGVPFPSDGVVGLPELMWMVDWWLWDNLVGCPVVDFAEPLVPNKEYRATTNGEDGHWYQYTPVAGGEHSFELLCRDLDSVLSIYEPNSVQGYDLLYSVHGDLLICNFVEDKPYYFEIRGWDGDTGTYILQMISGVLVPANDLCSQRTSIVMDYGDDGAYGSIEGRTYGATGIDETPNCGQDDVQDVWYSITLPIAGDYDISLSGLDESFMGTLAIFDGIEACPGTMLNCTELTYTKGYVDMIYNGQAGETIIIRAASSVSASGKFSIAVNLMLPPP